MWPNYSKFRYVAQSVSIQADGSIIQCSGRYPSLVSDEPGIPFIQRCDGIPIMSCSVGYPNHLVFNQMSQVFKVQLPVPIIHRSVKYPNHSVFSQVYQLSNPTFNQVYQLSNVLRSVMYNKLSNVLSGILIIQCSLKYINYSTFRQLSISVSEYSVRYPNHSASSRLCR